METTRICRGTTLVGALLLAVTTASAGPTPAQRCEQAKNKEAGKYAYCRQKVEAKFAVAPDAALRTAGLAKCAAKYALKWPLLEAKAAAAGGACPSVGDQTDIQEAIDAHTTDIATALAGGVLSPQGRRLRTGQTTCWNTAGVVVPCAGTGQDGELQTGLTRAYVDNGDGTITDTRTGLMWEKQSDDGTLNDKDDLYTWADAFAVKIAGLNAGGGFAGYTDWRLPNRAELESLVDLGGVAPSVSPAFDTSCTGGCTLATCSCTHSGSYWSSSTYAAGPSFAWSVFFIDGFVGTNTKTNTLAVRGVRGGS